MEIGDILKIVMSVVGGNWQLALIFGVVGLLALPIILPILKRQIQGYLKDLNIDRANKDTQQISAEDFDNKIKSHDEKSKVAKDDAKRSEQEKRKAMKKRRH